MAVTDPQVSTLRALLAGDYTRHREMLAALDRNADRVGYSALQFAAFYEAVKRRFGKTSGRAEVIQFVGGMRARSDEATDDLDPEVAERTIDAVFERASVDDLDDDTVVTYQGVLLMVLVADEELDEEQLDLFMRKVRAFADHMLST